MEQIHLYGSTFSGYLELTPLSIIRVQVGTALARPRACATMTQGHWEERGRAKTVPTGILTIFLRKDGELWNFRY